MSARNTVLNDESMHRIKRNNGLEDYMSSLSCPICNMRFPSTRRTAAQEGMTVSHVTGCSKKQKRNEHDDNIEKKVKRQHKNNYKPTRSRTRTRKCTNYNKAKNCNDMNTVQGKNKFYQKLLCDEDFMNSSASSSKNGSQDEVFAFSSSGTVSVDDNSSNLLAFPTHVKVKRSNLCHETLEGKDESPCENKEARSTNSYHEVKSTPSSASGTQINVIKKPGKDQYDVKVSPRTCTKLKYEEIIRNNHNMRRNKTKTLLFDNIKKRRKDDSSIVTCPICSRSFSRLKTSIPEINSHVMMCSDAQLYQGKTQEDFSPTHSQMLDHATTVNKSTESIDSLSSSTLSPLTKATRREENTPCIKVQSNHIISQTFARTKGVKRIYDRDVYMQLRRKSIKSLKRDEQAKRALELILLDDLSGS